MNFKALILSGTGGAVALIAAALFFLPAAATDTAADSGRAAAQPAPADESLAGMPASCPMWDDSESAAAAGMYEQCQPYMSESGMGHMMGMMNMMGSGGMNAGCGMSGMMTDAAGETTACPMLGAAESSGDQTAMGVCQQTDTES